MRHLELFGKLLFKQFMMIMIGLTCVGMLGTACFDSEPPPRPRHDTCVHHHASACTRFCTRNGMEVSSWNGEHPGSYCPNCGCICKPRSLNP